MTESKYKGMNKFECGKAMALMSAEIKNAAANVTRRFKAGMEVDKNDISTIREHATSMEKIVAYWERKAIEEKTGVRHSA